MIEVRDFGFATFLFMSGNEFVVDERGVSLFKITPEIFDRKLKEFRSSEFYIYDKSSKILKKKIQKSTPPRV